VQVQRQEHVPLARTIVGGDAFWGVPVLYEAVGDLYASAGVPHTIKINGSPVIGFGDATVSSPTVRAPSPWAVAITTSVVGAAVGWVIEEIAVHVRGKRSRS